MIAYAKLFIQECSALIAPLLDLTNKDTEIGWKTIRNYKFLIFKEKLVLAPILHYPIHNGYYQIKTDASEAVIGGVLQILKEKWYLTLA